MRYQSIFNNREGSENHRVFIFCTLFGRVYSQDEYTCHYQANGLSVEIITQKVVVIILRFLHMYLVGYSILTIPYMCNPYTLV
jgi:hypothetical protein